MSEMRIPERMLPVSALTRPVEVVRAPQLRLVGEGDGAKPKVTDSFPGRQAYSMTVEAVAGFRMKSFPGREPIRVADLRTVSVTVWAEKAPELDVGDYALLSEVCAGALERAFYVWALGAEKVTPEKKAQG